MRSQKQPACYSQLHSTSEGRLMASVRSLSILVGSRQGCNERFRWKSCRGLDYAMRRGAFQNLNARSTKRLSRGAATTVWCVTSFELDGIGGVYCEDVNIAVAVPATHEPLSGVLPWAIDPDAAERLWTLSEKLTGVKLSA